MEDPLRPKTVPLSAETILWFEFLLDPSLLTAHLAKENLDPSPVELISQFLSVSPENQCNQIDLVSPDIESTLNNGEGLKIGKKQLALKILGLKVASHINWNLDIIEKYLNLQKQVQLLSDLCTVTSGKYVSLPLSLVHECHIGPDGSKRAFNFALTLYHRWVLRAQLLKELPARVIKPGFGHMLTTQEQANSFRDEMFVASLEPFTQTSIDFLMQICKDDDLFGMLTYDSFVSLHPNSERALQNFDKVIPISKAELKAQIYYDLCTFYLHVKKYDLAREHIIECRKNLEELKKEYRGKTSAKFLFCTFSEEEMYGYLLACGVANEPLSLLHRMNQSVLQHYKDITEIFKADNISNEIPLVNRRIVELDIEGSTRSLNLPKDLLVYVASLNMIKSIIEDNKLFSFNDYLQKYTQQNGLNILVECAAQTMNSLSDEKRNRLKQFFLNLLLTSDDLKHLDTEILRKANLFSSEEILDIKRQRNGNDLPVPYIATLTDWKMCESKGARLDFGSMKRQLISCTNAISVRKLLVKLAGSNPSKPLWTINPSWIIPMPLQPVIMSLQRGFLQDFAYIIIGKAKELTTKRDYTAAISMLAVLKSETQRPELQNVLSVVKLSKMIDWEILLIQICHSLEDWPKTRYDTQIMINKCKQCLLTLQNGDNVVPRIEILDYCAAMLLNLNEWNALVMLDKRFPSLELCSIFVNAIIESENFKSKKIFRDAWDYVLPMFSTSNKRGPASSRDSPTIVVGTNLIPFLKKIRNVTVISFVLSLLAKLHNLLKDDTNMELVTDYLMLWPTSISNASGYSIRTVSETLSNLLKQALSFYPQHIPWIRLKGELEFVNENYEAAMSCYVNVLITGTEYCALHLQRPLLDDHIVKRMIKCCTNLGCNMQAAVLCQFLEETDYMMAFKSISEKTSFKNIGDKSTNFCDAMDAYYNCIWDSTLLEFIINQHSKKGEHKRKQQAISIMGQLELNANNNEEIKREAASIRRTKFLRALAKQYML